MAPLATTALGILAGLNLFLAMAVMGVIAVNGPRNPGVPEAGVSAAAGASAAASASAPPPSGGLERSAFGPLDLDGDGALSLSESAGYREIVIRFERADRNRDGRLSKAEFDRLAKLSPPKAKVAPNARLQVRRDANASLAAQREER